MESKLSKFVGAKEFANEFEITVSAAYKKIQALNNDLKNKGYMTVSGKIPRKLFDQICYWKTTEKDVTSAVQSQ